MTKIFDKDSLKGLSTKSKIYEKLDELNIISAKYNMVFSIVRCDINFINYIDYEYTNEIFEMIKDVLVRFLGYTGIIGKLYSGKFIIILPCIDQNIAHSITEYIKEEIMNKKNFIRFKDNIAMSFGISSSYGEKNVEDLIHEAEASLSYDKKPQIGL